MDKTKIIILTAIIGVLAIVIVLVLSGGEEPYDGSEEEMMSSHEDVTLETTEGGLNVIQEDPQERLERYKKWAQYPPHSRPLFEGQVDLIEPYNAERPPVGVIDQPASPPGCNIEGTGGKPKCETQATFTDFKCEMTPESSISVGKPDFKVTLRCFGGKENKNQPIENIQAKVYKKLFRKITGSLPPVSQGDNGTDGDKTAGDLVYTFVVRPATTDWGFMFLEAEFTVNGKKHNQRATWFSTPHTIATFNAAGITDRIQDGSLLVSVPVNVRKAGYYEIEANLQEAEGEQKFVATARYEGELEAGNQTVPLQFWGKIIRDKRARGPFVVREIRGSRNNDPVTPAIVKRAQETGGEIPEPNYNEPLREYMQPADDYTTAAYKPADFSNREWESEEKNRRIEFLSSLAE